MSSIYDWSTTEANNATADSGINWQEGQLPSTVNNSARYMMRRGKELLNDIGAVATASGTANALTLTASSPFPAYQKGIRLLFKASATNTGNATLNVNAVGAKSIVYLNSGAELPIGSGFISSGGIYEVVYDPALAGGSGAWVLLNPQMTSGAAQQGHLYGLVLSNNSGDAANDIDIAAGNAASDASPYHLMVLASSLTKRLDAAWAVGTGNGGLDTGSIGNNTYHVWLIQRSDTGVVDALFSLSATAPTMPSNYDRKRRIGSIIRSGGTILGFSQNGDTFILNVGVTDRSSALAQASTLLALTVPTGIVVQPIMLSTQAQNAVGNIQTQFSNAGGGLGTYVTTVASQEIGIAYINGGIFTDTSARIQFAVVIIGGSLTSNSLTTRGWIDGRGRS
ncbi:hypothetical protein V6R85_01505 [Agrobacterium sp. CCNWLW32]|uniref:hypothetical protein n=1 Tax=Agrobacterium sp. CCNWLW32 TaxID=3122072 RepID=UPI0030104FFB